MNNSKDIFPLNLVHNFKTEAYVAKAYAAGGHSREHNNWKHYGILGYNGHYPHWKIDEDFYARQELGKVRAGAGACRDTEHGLRSCECAK